MSEADVRDRYPVGLRVQSPKYDPKGRYLVVQGMEPADSARRLIFETDGQRVVRDRAGVTGPDGPSHNGMWDGSILQVVPGLRIAAPRDATRIGELLGEAGGVSF